MMAARTETAAYMAEVKSATCTPPPATGGPSGSPEMLSAPAIER